MHTLTPAQLNTLSTMLTYCRPHGSAMDHEFRRVYLASLPGIHEDAYGNLIVDIGESPRVLWSSHTDTVHWYSGRQRLHVDTKKQTIRLARKSRKRSECLGADDTVGVFLMREMILTGVEGRYIFHYGEESGCIGSSDLAANSPETLTGIDFAIALDRMGTSDIITTQNGSTCCSDLFAHSLALALGLPYTSARGIFTDTAEYVDLIPECTNISVGYYNQHGPDEYVDYSHVGILLAALIAMDQSQLVCSRDPYAPKVQRSYLVDASARDYSYIDKVASDIHSAIDRIDGNTSTALWRESYGWSDWCLVCDAPVIDEDDPDFHDTDHCVCPHDDDLLDSTHGMSEDDVRFMRYLRGLD